ncbi:MAG: hypothetical protein IK027_00175 [Deltaproteobacteria bacterium]|nr:hypothetical protein [Deltaproteobacteria bacterium]
MTAEQLTTLRVLAYLFFRMGHMERAGRVFAALAALADPECPDLQANVGLAAVALEQGHGKEALEHLRTIMENKDRAFSSKEAVFYLMRAQALWMEGRREEAKSMVETYLHLMGDSAQLKNLDDPERFLRGRKE